MILTLAVVVAIMVALRRRGRDAADGGRVESVLASRWAPLVVGVCYAAVAWWTWGQLHPPGLFHDELSYLLQARLFAQGRWSAPSPPVPDLFAQAHVLVTPVMASKYPPGHSLLLALGTLVGTPVVIVLALDVLRIAMTFALARRLTDGSVALLTCLLLVHGDSLRFSASYFSQTTTGALLVVGWYALLRWYQGDGRRWILLLALALGWCAITRPYSAVLFALPIGFVVVRRVAANRSWRDLGLAMAVGTALVAVIPLWSARTTGSWRLWPATLYTRDYMPFDRPHFGVDSTPARRMLPNDLATMMPSLRDAERQHTIASLPAVTAERLGWFASATWRVPPLEAGLGLLGVVAAPAATWVGIATVATVVAGYLAHPTWANWTVYYVEVAPVLAFLTVCGLAALLRGVGRASSLRSILRAPPAGSLALGVVTAIWLLYAQHDVRVLRRQEDETHIYQRQFRARLRMVPSPAILFVRHADWHPAYLSLITNGPDWPGAPVWVVAERGAALDDSLVRSAPNRRPYLFDEQRGIIRPYQPLESSSGVIAKPLEARQR